MTLERRLMEVWRYRRRQLAELDYVTSFRAASQSLTENYVGSRWNDAGFSPCL
jgi:hypothetical protein